MKQSAPPYLSNINAPEPKTKIYLKNCVITFVYGNRQKTFRTRCRTCKTQA